MINKDEQIKRDVVEHLLWNNRVDVSTITVAVDNGIVSLGGETSSYPAKDAALKIAWGIPGVKNVRDNITIPNLEVSPSDVEVKTSVKSTLIWNRNIDASKITLDVNDGKISLEGNVDAHWKIDYVESMISDIHGVISVENKLSVIPDKNIVDESIAENIAGQIDRNLLIEGKDIIIKVKDGNVFLSGKVPTFMARRFAYKIASKCPGTKDVKNDLVVDRKLLNPTDISP